MSEYHPSRVRPPRPRFTLRRALNFWPVLVWAAALAMAYWAYRKGVEFKRMNGLVDPIQEAVAADEDGRIAKILVKSGQSVKAGDPLVQMDTAVIDQQIAKLETAIKSDLEERILEQELSLSRLKGEKRELLRDQASDQGELAGIKPLLEEVRKAPNNPLTAQLLARLSGTEGRLNATAPLYATQIEEVDSELNRLSAEIDKLRKGLADPEKLASANGDLADLQELRIMKDRAILRSGHDGTVDRVERDDGEFIVKGQTILRVVAAPEVIRAFLPQDQIGKMAVNNPVWISSTADKYSYFKTKVLAVSPRVTNAPDVTSPLPNRVLHGQEIVVDYPPDCGYRPGQTVIIHLAEPGSMPWFTKVFGQGSEQGM